MAAVVSDDPGELDDQDMVFAVAAARWLCVLLDRPDLAARAMADAAQAGPPAAGEPLTRLSRREREVAALVAEGLTNAEVGERLELTQGTVANYVRNALLKLGRRGRAQLAVWAVEHGLYRSGAPPEGWRAS